jgi:hypothetical protein
VTASVTGLNTGYAIDGQENGFHTPETAASQHDTLFALGRRQVLFRIGKTATWYVETRDTAGCRHGNLCVRIICL